MRWSYIFYGYTRIRQQATWHNILFNIVYSFERNLVGVLFLFLFCFV